MVDFLLQPWAWLTVGAILIALEIVLPGYFLLGFGLAASAVAMGLAFTGGLIGGFNGALVFAILVSIWLVLGMGAWYLMARVLRGSDPRPDINDFDGRPRY